MKEQLVARFTVSLPPALLQDLDKMVCEKGHANRSQAVADLIRAGLVEHRQEYGSGEIAGTITLVYDHHQARVQTTLTDIQHDHHDVIISSLHVHLDHDNCLEVLVVRGRADRIKKIAEELIAAKGVKHGKLTVTSTGVDLPS
ncbi:MAG: nickel-responsive transcriptional regulator NikR [Limisphaerales bacterium]|jgi:CopG family nickel-responsive transcriptional regulator